MSNALAKLTILHAYWHLFPERQPIDEISPTTEFDRSVVAGNHAYLITFGKDFHNLILN